jgi:hypothetical protein
VLFLRCGRNAGDQVRKRFALEEGVSIDGDNERRRDPSERPVQRPVLPRFGLEEAPVIQAEASRSFLRSLGRTVGRVVVGQHDLHRALVRLIGDPLERRNDPLLLVPGRDHDGDRRPLVLGPRPWRRHERADGTDSREVSQS